MKYIYIYIYLFIYNNLEMWYFPNNHITGENDSNRRDFGGSYVKINPHGL